MGGGDGGGGGTSALFGVGKDCIRFNFLGELLVVVNNDLRVVLRRVGENA